MAQLRRDYQKLSELDTEVVVVGPEGAESFRKFWENEDLPFIGLPDPDHRTAKLYGQEFKLLKLGRMPAQMLIDKSGKLRYAYYGNSMADITPNDDIMTLARRL